MRASPCEKKKQGCPNFLWLLFLIVTSAHIEQWDRPPPVQTGAHMSPVLCSVDGTSKRSLKKKMESAAEALLCKDAAALEMKPAGSDLCLRSNN